MNRIIKRKNYIYSLFFLAYFIFCNIQVLAYSKVPESKKREYCFSNQRNISGELELYMMETEKDCSSVAQMSYEDLMKFLTTTYYTTTLFGKKEEKPIISKEPEPPTDFCELGFKLIDGSPQIYCPYHGSIDGFIPPNNSYTPSPYFQKKINKKNLPIKIAHFLQNEGSIIIFILIIVFSLHIIIQIIKTLIKKISKNQKEKS